MTRFPAALALLLLSLLPTAVFAQTTGYVEVTATKLEEDVVSVPTSVTVITGEELEREGVTDLATALSHTAGVTGARGGDAGPASTTPELWGLREADAFLLIVDGIPWGSAFLPPSEAVDLRDIDRIEIVRGSAPVVYGATAFSGVIQVIHKRADTPHLMLTAGSFGSSSISAAMSGFSALIERERFADDDAGSDRVRLGYHHDLTTAGGRWRFDAEALRLAQDPASPHVREGRVLSPRMALDANLNPRDAHLDTTRLHFGAAYDTQLATMPWTTTVALTRTDGDVRRGFVRDLGTLEATGFGQDRSITELYFDTRVVRQVMPVLRVLAGVDYSGGHADAESEIFDYVAGTSGETARREGAELEDTRNFAAVYAQGEWTPSAAWRVDLGARLNHARETRDDDSRTTTRGSGFVGVSRRIVGDVWAFADYRNSFKPALVDFSPLEDEEMLAPETSNSYELGVKGRQGRFFWQTSAFVMDLQNLVVSAERDGLPELVNGGQQRFRGWEAEVHFAPTKSSNVFATYARHDARFRDFVQDFDGVLTQLRGRRLELSPSSLASAGASATLNGWTGSVAATYTGPRWLNKRNSALAEAFTTIDAGIGRHFAWGDLRVDGINLTDRRDPVAESELGDAQYYRMGARAFRVTWSREF